MNDVDLSYIGDYNLALERLGSSGVHRGEFMPVVKGELLFFVGPVRNKQSVGELLAGFFSYYGYTFSIPNWVISIRTTDRVTKQNDLKFKEKRLKDRFQKDLKSSSPTSPDAVFSYRPGPRWRFYVEDPFEVKTNKVSSMKF